MKWSFAFARPYRAIQRYSFSTYTRTLYEELGVKPTCEPREIYKAYIQLAKTLHPDMNTHKSASEVSERAERFKRVSKAYSILNNPETRRSYDAELLINNKFTKKKVWEEDMGFKDGVYDARRYPKEAWFHNWNSTIHRETEDTWNTMREQRNMNQRASSWFHSKQNSAPIFTNAFFRVLPLYILPVLLIYALYSRARLRRAAEESLPVLIRDELGRAFLLDQNGQPYRAKDFDSRKFS